MRYDRRRSLGWRAHGYIYIFLTNRYLVVSILLNRVGEKKLYSVYGNIYEGKRAIPKELSYTVYLLVLIFEIAIFK